MLNTVQLNNTFPPNAYYNNDTPNLYIMKLC